MRRLDEAARQRGLANIRAIRAQMTGRGANTAPVPAVDDAADADVTDKPSEPRPPTSPLDDPAMMAAQMAAGAERERLERRIANLEAENAALRRTLADIVTAAAAGLAPAAPSYDRESESTGA